MMEELLENDFEQLHPQCTRKVELRRMCPMNEAKPRKGRRDIEEQDSDTLEEWANKGQLAFLHDQQEWGNNTDGNEWVATQRKLKQRELAHTASKDDFHQYVVSYVEYKADSFALNPVGQKSFERFTDKDFPATQESLTGQWGSLKKYEGVKWKKISEMMKDCRIFDGKVSPRSIREGRVGDGYFLAALAALAERLDRIFNIFVTHEINKQHRFAIKMLLKGRLQVVEVDEYFPYFNKQAVCSGTKNHNELWVMILEKARAKLFGNYMAISSGHVSECLHDLTCAPVNFIPLKNNSKLNQDKIWKYLLKGTKKEYAMCASLSKGAETMLSETGPVQGNTETILNAFYLNHEGNRVKMLQMRNPWSNKKLQNSHKVKWSYNDPNWKNIEKQQKERLKFEEGKNQGIFYTSFDQFLLNYRSLTVAQIDDQAHYVYQTARDPTSQGVCFKVELYDTTDYTFQIDSCPKNMLSVKDNNYYCYPPVTCKILSGRNRQLVDQFKGEGQNNHHTLKLSKGTYYVNVLVIFDPQFERQFDVTLGLYSRGGCSIKLADTKEQSELSVVYEDKVQGRTPSKRKRFRSRSRSKPRVTADDGYNEEYIDYRVMGKTNINFTYEDSSIKSEQNFHVQIIDRKKHRKEGSQNPEDIAKQFAKTAQELGQKIRKHRSTIGKISNEEIAKNIEKQVVFIEDSPAHDKLQELKQKKQDFKDERFPPNLYSLTGQWGKVPEWNEVKWQRISKAMPNAQIFKDSISPSDIRQGFLGDCYFLAGLAALTQKPDRIANLFLLTERNETNFYSCKILYRGKWLTVDMDDYLPYMYDKPAFSRAAGDELWVALLEKAWAKVYSNYKRIEAGFPQEPLHDLTAAPIRRLFLKQGNCDPEENWKYLMLASMKQYAMVASSQAGADTDQSQKGIVQGHAYTLMKAVEMNFKGKNVRLVKLRNPWGKGQSSTCWNDNDKNWKDVSEAEKQRIGYSNKDDGIFFFSYEEFLKQFRIITIAQINDDASYVYHSEQDHHKQGCYFTINIQKEGNYSFQVDNTPERTFEDHGTTSYRYPRTEFALAKVTGKGYVKKLINLSQSSRTLYFQGDGPFQPGTYICFVKVDFSEKYEKDFHINLACYGEYPCQIKASTHKEASLFSNNPNVAWPHNKEEKASNVEWNALRGFKPQQHRRRRF